MLHQLIKNIFLLILFCLVSCVSSGEIKVTGSQSQAIPDVARLKFSRAVWAAKSGHDEEAIKLFNELTHEHPKLARAYTNLGMLHLKNKELTSAEQALTKSVHLNPHDAIAQNHLGVVLRKLGKFIKAEQAYLLAVKNDPEYVDALLNLGVLYDLYLHNIRKALIYYNKAQTFGETKDELLEKWIIDTERRIKRIESSS